MQTEYAIIYLEINLFSIILVYVIWIKTRGLSQMVAQRNFAMSIIAEMVFFASDTLYVLMNNGILPGGDIPRLLCKTAYFFSTSIMCFFWFLYFEHMQESDFVKERIKVRLASSVIWLMGGLLLVNFMTGFLFYIDDDGVYQRGPLFILTYVLSYSYVIFTCLRAIYNICKTNTGTDKRNYVLIALFPIAPGAAGILQFIWPQYPVACGVLSLTTLLLYLNWIDKLISLDPLTGLNNRKQLQHYYDHNIQGHSNEGTAYYLLLIDANKFKAINDTYGHLQGDKALKNIAESLRVACKELSKRANIARYGGDEFVVLLESDNDDTPEKLKVRINEILADINKKTKVPFELTVSVGISKSGSNGTLKELIDEADEKMYKDKSKRRS